ncbi:hypothetical protein, partial [Scandinavium sp.]|uniref:hypothetical protein n=1 Tax=Scandinavium sp. TaxID=2830653 RepID=UPI0028A1C9E4
RIIGGNSETASINSKKLSDRSLFVQHRFNTTNFVGFLNKNEPKKARFCFWSLTAPRQYGRL